MSRANPRFHRVNPPLPTATGAVYQLLISGLIDGQRWVLDFGLMASSAVQTSSSEGNLMTSWLASLSYTRLRNCIADDVIFDTAKISCVSTPSRLPFVQNGGGAAGLGTVAGGHQNSELAGIISKYTGTKGQHGRGRNYIPGVPNSFVTTGVGGDPNHLNGVGNGAYANLASALLAMTLADGATTASLAVYTRPPKGQPVTLAALCVQCFDRTLLGTVRRRRIGRGK